MARNSPQRAACAVILAVCVLAGCGDDSSAPSADSSPAAPSAPSRSVNDADQLVGVWYQPGENADIMAMEFGADGKVMVTVAFGSTRTWDYSVMEGGRLRLIVPGGETFIFRSKADGDALLLEPEDSGMLFSGPQQFRRLRGQTIAEARKADMAEQAQRREAMLDAVRKQLTQPNLVLESSDPQVRLSRHALELTGGPDSFEGRSWSEGNPPLMRHARVQIQQGEVPQVVVMLGDVLGPPGEPPRNPLNITLTGEGSPEKLELAEKGLALRSNSDAHSALVKAYDQVIAEREAAIAKVIDPLGSYARIDGQFITSNNPNARPIPVRFGLLRVKDQPVFMVADLRNTSNPSPEQFVMQAAAQIDPGTKKVLIVCPQLQFAMEPVERDGKLVLHGGYQNWEIEVPVVEALKLDELNKRREANKAFLNGQLAAGLNLRGRMHVDNSRGEILPVPLTLSLKSDAQRNLTGKIVALHVNAEFDLAGTASETLAGIVLKFQSTQQVTRTPYSTLAGRNRSGSLDLTWDGDTPVITGAIAGGFEVGPVQWQVASPEQLKAERQTLTQILSSGSTFAVFDHNRGNTAPMLFTFKLDPASGAVSGESNAGGVLAPVGAAKISGELTEQDGFVFLKLRHAEGVDGRNRKVPGANHALWALIDGDEIILSGWTLSDNSNPPTVQSTKMARVK